MKKPQLATFVFTSLVAISGSLIAADTGSRYQSWNPPGNETVYQTGANHNDSDKYQQMIDRLNVLINDAETSRAADRRFIADLRDVLREYDWPWRTTMLSEDFMDGIVSKSPEWIIDSGNFEVKRGYGLKSRVTAQKANGSSKKSSDKELAVAILGAILEEAAKSNGDDSKDETRYTYNEATIHAGRRISNAFALDIAIEPLEADMKASFSLYQHNINGSAYKLVFVPGTSASIELHRVGSRGSSIISISDHLKTSTKTAQKIQWTRDKLGNMTVSLNGKKVMQTSDRGLRDPYDGFAITNHRGAFAVQQVHISGI